MLHIIVNGAKNKPKHTQILNTLKSQLDSAGKIYTLHYTAYARHATEIARELSAGDNVDIVVLGGDGTVSETVKGIRDGCHLRLGIIPCGTGNDFVRAMDKSINVDRAIEAVVVGNTRYVDYISMPNGKAINVAGAGMDVDTLVKYDSMKFWKGKVKYYLALLHVLTHLQFHKLRLELDGVVYERSVFMIALANGNYIGGGMPVAPDSQVDNGKINVVIINEIPKRKVISMLMKFLKGQHIKEECVEQYYCDRAVITVLDEGKIEIDGEVIDDKVLDCAIVPKGIELFW